MLRPIAKHRVFSAAKKQQQEDEFKVHLRFFVVPCLIKKIKLERDKGRILKPGITNKIGESHTKTVDLFMCLNRWHVRYHEMC